MGNKIGMLLDNDRAKCIKWAEEARTAKARLQEACPNIFDLEALYITVVPSGIHIHIKKPGQLGKLHATLLEYTGQDRVLKTINGIYTSTKYTLPNNFVITIHDPNRAPCKRYRVVEEKVIEVCGDIDASRYTSVEEL